MIDSLVVQASQYLVVPNAGAGRVVMTDRQRIELEKKQQRAQTIQKLVRLKEENLGNKVSQLPTIACQKQLPNCPCLIDELHRFRLLVYRKG